MPPPPVRRGLWTAVLVTGALAIYALFHTVLIDARRVPFPEVPPEPFPRTGRAAGASVVLVVLQNARGDGVSLEGFSQDTPPRLRNFFLEGVGIRRFYTNAVDPARAWEALLSARRPRPGAAPVASSWPRVLQARGYRAAAFGAFDPAETRVLANAGIDPVQVLPHDGYDPQIAAARALAWAAKEKGPYVLVVYLRGLPARRWPSPRFWRLSPAPVSPARAARWREAAVQASGDDTLGRLLDALPPGPVVSVVSLAGSFLEERPVRHSGRRGAAVWSEGGLGLRESEARAVWCVRHPSLPSGRLLAQPGQTIDVGPTLLKLVEGGALPGAEGQAFDLRRETPVEGVSSRITIRGRNAKALLIDGHYKYIRHAGAARRRVRGVALWTDYPREEIFDLWSDPGEGRNLTLSRRTLLARARQVMGETDPDPVDICLAFRGAAGARVEGGVNCAVNGLSVSPGATVAVSPRGRYEFSFVVDSSGALVFQTDPPGASYLMRLTAGGRPFPRESLRVSGLALPLFESLGDVWHDKNKFAWMDGWPVPRGDDAVPTVYLGRRERDPVWPLSIPAAVTPSAPPPAARPAVFSSTETVPVPSTAGVSLP